MAASLDPFFRAMQDFFADLPEKHGREPLWESTVAEQKAKNSHMSKCATEAEFVAVREARDRTLPMPALILPSVQTNIRAGALPDPEDNGVRYLKLPIDTI